MTLGSNFLDGQALGLMVLLAAAVLPIPALSQAVSLTVSDVKETSANLTIANHAGAWWHEGSQDGASCGSVGAGVSRVEITGLTGGNSYTWTAYGDAGCSTALASENFTTISFTASDITAKTATLTLGHNSQQWSMKRILPAGGECIQDWVFPFDPDDTTWNLTGLAEGASHTYQAYSSGDCIAGNEIADVSFTTTEATLSVSAITQTTATLTLSDHDSAAWWYQGSQSGASCTSVAAGTTVASLANLDRGTEHTYRAYDQAQCSVSDEIASRTFTTLADKPGAPHPLPCQQGIHGGHHRPH